MSITLSNSHHKIPGAVVHVMVWAFILGVPFMLFDRQMSTADMWKTFLRFAEMPCYVMAIFYLNYFWLIPQFLFKGKTREFLLWNCLFILLACVLMHYLPWYERVEPPPHRRGGSGGGRLSRRPPGWVFFIRDFMTLAFGAAASATIRMSSRWRSAEIARQKAEKSRSQAELKNLKNQLSPHFLLNTLNNIYALILFNAEKAQEAVLDLSKLLRYVLYENQTDFVPLYKEVEFIQNYIELMRIRLSDNVKVETEFRMVPGSVTPVAPLLFISLIENAFKHGTSPQEPSYIRILLEEERGTVICRIENSNFPKSENDKSGSGIGLEQVRARLEHLYPGKYEWNCGPSEEGTYYYSTLIIYIEKKSFDHENNLCNYR